MQPEELIDLAGARVGRNWTYEEWQQTFAGEPYRKTFQNLPGPND
jgi:hypothetical protein